MGRPGFGARTGLDMRAFHNVLPYPRETAEPLSAEAHKQLETIEFREPYRMGGVLRPGEKRAVRPELKLETAADNGLNCQRVRPENTLPRAIWRSERYSNPWYGLHHLHVEPSPKEHWPGENVEAWAC